MDNFLLRQRALGKKTIGTFFELGGEAVIEALAIGGMDYVIIDGEHGPFESENTVRYVRTAENSGMTPLVRIKEISRAAVLKALDAGAMGLIVPCVQSLQDAEHLVSWAKFPSLGQRGFFPARTSQFGRADFASPFEAYFATCNTQQLLLPQCETLGALEDIEAIVALDGVDGIFVGPFDLSIALGTPGQFDAPVFQAALDRILAACRANNKMSLIFAANDAVVASHYARGFDSVALRMDVDFLIQAVAASLQAAKEDVE